jgi:hypothetical protein
VKKIKIIIESEGEETQEINCTSAVVFTLDLKNPKKEDSAIIQVFGTWTESLFYEALPKLVTKTDQFFKEQRERMREVK